MPNLKAILALGQISHDSVASALSLKKKDHRFGHGARYEGEKVTLLASYHCSRYNTNTGVLTEAMFDAVMAAAKDAARL
jgi:uracil-DNA glycosylase